VTTATLITVALAALAAFALSACVTRALAGTRLRDRLLDVPNERSLHGEPTPRGGGIGILVGAACGYGALLATGAAASPGTGLLAGLALVAVVSLLDDLWRMPVALRLAVHLLAALALLLAHGPPEAITVLPGVTIGVPAAAGIALGLLFTVWMLNLYNFMDGMDGLAGSMAAIGFGCLAALGALAGAPSFAALALLIACGAGGFLIFNLPPARIFLGDVGSVPLGFLAAALILRGEREGLFPFWVGVLVFSPFIVDATVTMLRRLAAGERIWRAHRSHYYQRMVAAGWSHGRTLRAEVALMAGCALCAVAATAFEHALVAPVVGAGWAIGYTTLIVAMRRLPAR